MNYLLGLFSVILAYFGFKYQQSLKENAQLKTEKRKAEADSQLEELGEKLENVNREISKVKDKYYLIDSKSNRGDH